MKNNYSLTVKACSVGYIVQSVANNLLPLLFVYLTTNYLIPLYLISILLAYNFGLQILVDSLSSNVVLKLGYRKTALLASFLVGVGLLFLSLVPFLFKGYILIYIGLLISVTFMAIGSGISELIFSSLLEALPIENKQQKMSLIHSFYCVGHLIVVVVATLFFVLIGIDKWYYLPLMMLVFPILNFALFIKCPVLNPIGDNAPISKLKIIKNKEFLLIFVLMVCAGASEQAVAQWISYFAESSLKINKAFGDVVGVGAFATTMLISRTYFACTKKRYNLLKTVFCFAVALAVCLTLSVFLNEKIVSLILLAICGLFVGVMWPAIYSVGGKLFKMGGTAMFSLLALGGDLGCTLGPTVVGGIGELFSIKAGILLSSLYPIIMIIVISVVLKKQKNGKYNTSFKE